MINHLKILGFKNRGLSNIDALHSEKQHGSNKLTPPVRETLWEKFIGNFEDPIIRILVVALIIEVVLSFFGYTPWYEALGIAIAVAIATGIAAWSENKNEGSFAKLQEEASKIVCNVFREGELETMSINNIVVGDLVLLQPGDKVPADGIIKYGNLNVIQALLTGESDFVKKTAKPDEFDDYESFNKGNVDDQNIVFRGTIVAEGEAVIEVVEVGDNTFLGKIASELAEKEERKSPLQVKLAKLGDGISTFGYIAAPLIALSFMFKNAVMDNGYSWSLIQEYFMNFGPLVTDIVHAVILAVIIIVVAVPEGLPLMIAMVLSMNMGKLVHDNVLVRKILGIETSGSLNRLFVDKTGTITYGRLSTDAFLSGNNVMFNSFNEITPALAKKLQFALVNNTNSIINFKNGTNEVVGGNPTERAMMEFVAADLTEDHDNEINIVNSVPFNSKLKFSATQLNGKANITLVKGAPEMLLPKCNKFYDENGEEVKLKDKKKLLDRFNELSERQFRVVAVATSTEKINGNGLPKEMTLVGVMCIRDAIREESKKSIETTLNAGINITMITGDRPETAIAIAKEIGLINGNENTDSVITSQRLSEMSDDEVIELLPDLKVVSRALPTDKSRLVRLAQEMGEVVGMTGDGVNDAPALQTADVGYSMGQGGTEVAKEASDVVILDDNLLSIKKAVLYGRTIYNSIRKFVIFQLTVNVAAILVAFLGPFFGYDFPLTMVQMLWINLIMDTLAALAFGGEAALERYMYEKPKQRDESIISKDMWSSILINGVIIAILSIIFLESSWVRNFFTSEKAYMTGFFGFFVFMHNWNKFNARTERLNLFDHILKNKTFLQVVGMIFVVQIVFTYLGGEILRTVPLSLNELLFILGTSFVIIPIDLIRKAIRNAIQK